MNERWKNRRRERNYGKKKKKSEEDKDQTFLCSNLLYFEVQLFVWKLRILAG